MVSWVSSNWCVVVGVMDTEVLRSGPPWGWSLAMGPVCQPARHEAAAR